MNQITNTAADRLLSPLEVAVLFGVSTGCVRRWARAGKVACLRTPGGRLRFSEAEIHALLQESTS